MSRRTRQQLRRTRMLWRLACIVWAVFLLAVLCVKARSEEKAVRIPEELTPTAETVLKSISGKDEDSEQQGYENERIESALLKRAARIENCTVTYYCCERYPHICNAGDPYKTCTGSDVVPGFTCAVDPFLIELGSTVFVDYGDGEVHTYLADDIGGGVTGGHIDIAVASHREALQLGVRTATVYYLPEGR